MDKNWTYSESLKKSDNCEYLDKSWSIKDTFKIKEHTLLFNISVNNSSDAYTNLRLEDFFFASIDIVHEGREDKRKACYLPGYTLYLNYSLSKRDAYFCLFRQVRQEICHSVMLTENEKDTKRFREILFSYAGDRMPKEINKYAYPMTKKICSILVSKIFKKFEELSGISQDENFEIIKTVHRLYPTFKKSCYRDKSQAVLHLMRLKKSLPPQDYNMIIGDLKKYPVMYAREISRDLHKINSIPQYQTICGVISPIIKKCKYIAPLNPEIVKFLEENKIHPHSKFQWYFYPILADLNERLLITKPDDEEPRWFNNDFGLEKKEIEKMFRCDIELWHEYKKLNRVKGPYSIKKITQMLGTILDGCRIYHIYKDNDYGFSVYPVSGSPTRILRNAIFNHNQNRKITIKEIEKKENYKRITMPNDFPAWIKAIELKDSKSVLVAGKECQHCIGSYARDNGCYLVRENDICAQIDRAELTIVQCYDVGDTITKESKSLRLRLESSLKKYKKQKEKELTYA